MGEARIPMSQVLNFIDLFLSLPCWVDDRFLLSSFIHFLISLFLHYPKVWFNGRIIADFFVPNEHLVICKQPSVSKQQAHCPDEVPLLVKGVDEKLAVSSWRTEAGSFPLLCPLRWADWSRDLPSLQFHFSKQNFENKKLINLYSEMNSLFEVISPVSCMLFPIFTLSELPICIRDLSGADIFLFMIFRVMIRRDWISGAIRLTHSQFHVLT